MKAILIGGPRHLDEFEIGEALPPCWYVPVPPTFGMIQEQLSPWHMPPPLHQTHCYKLHLDHYGARQLVAGRAIYVSEDEL